jgi:signal transduction histidine kinase
MAFAALNIVAMWAFPGKETIPFHLVWLSLAVVYGYAAWRRWFLYGAVALVGFATGVPMAFLANRGVIGWEEVSEVPLMMAIMVAMAWYVWRHQRALGTVQRLADNEARSASTQELLVRFASHELRTPITVARGYTELVRSTHDDRQTWDDTGIVLDELDKLALITERLVTMMTVPRPQRLRALDLDEYVGHLMKRWSPTAHRTWLVEGRVGTVLADPDRLETALDCLLHNAVKFTRRGDRITLSCWRADDRIFIEVADSGCGYAPNSPTDTRPGSGLGLTIVRTIVEARGGSLHISGAAGVGTVARICVPITPLSGRDPVRAAGSSEAV